MQNTPVTGATAVLSPESLQDLIGILTGHAALIRIKRSRIPGRRRAVWGLVLGYTGLFFTILLIAVVLSLLAAGIGVGVLDKIIPALPRH